MGAACIESVTNWQNLTQNLEIPERFQEVNPIKTAEDFDVNLYFSAFSHLSIEPGYDLDFVYFGDDLGGKPLIYARPTTQESYATYAEFIKAVGEPSYWERSYDYLEHAHDFMEFIRTDDTAEGYLQFIMLALLGDQFYLYWHALYNDTVFICGGSDIDKIVAEVESFEVELPEDIVKEAKLLDFEPTVLLEEEAATVQFIFFTKWGGFIQSWFTVTREYPHQVIDGGSDLLIQYDCGISF